MVNIELKGSHGTNQNKCAAMPVTPISHAFTLGMTCIRLMFNIQPLSCSRAYKCSGFKGTKAILWSL